MENFLEEYTKWLDDSKEHLSNRSIATYLNLKEILSDKEKQFIEDHLNSCSECQNKFEQIAAEDEEMDELANEEEPVTKQAEQVKVFTLQNVIRYAAAAVIFIAMLFVAYYMFIKKDEVLITKNNKPETKIDTLNNLAQQDSAGIPQIVEPEEQKKEKPEKIHLESFAVNDVLENFINRNIRSGEKINILQPGIGDTVSLPITFKWNQQTGTGYNELIIVDNKNQSLYQAAISGKEITIDKKFSKGLYYWKLLVKDKLEAVGKFYIIR